MRVLIAVAEIGHGVQLEEVLGQAGFEATWDRAQADGPTGAHQPDVVVIDGEALDERLGEVVAAWRAQPGVPAVVAIGQSADARDRARAARVALVAPSAPAQALAAAIRGAAKLRLAAELRWPVLRAALDLPPADNAPAAWGEAVRRARDVDVELARSALGWHVHDYATPTELLDPLRDERVLSVPELETAAHVDGTRTVQTLVQLGPLDPPHSARLIWLLASLGAIDLTPEVRDHATDARRSLDELRAHVRRRVELLNRATYYDVLELTPLAEYPEIEAAYQLVGRRFAPQLLARWDLGELARLAEPIWKQVETARRVLVDDAARGHYTDWLRQHLPELDTVWAIAAASSTAAAEAFARGQRALADGDVHRAMSELAMACRHHAGHPEYEANLAWVRYRIQVAGGKDPRATAIAERDAIADVLRGRRPWPRALVALAMLCAAAGDAAAARWHVRVALTHEPGLPAARQLARRLGAAR